MPPFIRTVCIRQRIFVSSLEIFVAYIRPHVALFEFQLSVFRHPDTIMRRFLFASYLTILSTDNTQSYKFWSPLIHKGIGSSDLAVYGNKFVYNIGIPSSNGPTSRRLIMHDLSTGEDTKLSPENFNGGTPSIYKNLIVWEETSLLNNQTNCLPEKCYDYINIYDLKTGKLTPIIIENIQLLRPYIYENHVVWDSYQGVGNLNKIYLATLS